jgi:hypothetical protein
MSKLLAILFHGRSQRDRIVGFCEDLRQLGRSHRFFEPTLFDRRVMPPVSADVQLSPSRDRRRNQEHLLASLQSDGSQRGNPRQLDPHCVGDRFRGRQTDSKSGK